MFHVFAGIIVVFSIEVSISSSTFLLVSSKILGEEGWKLTFRRYSYGSDDAEVRW